ncbi:MAG: DegT/DnrJ/EryC1/StrS family aminotransferase, partial [Deltaproteobacteria bacterium]|nr:DegT/DnrJ/EryC1/StrS family aminotransferase [Deltaproteobacteria bacterium]
MKKILGCLGGETLFPFRYELAPPDLPPVEELTPRLRDAFSRRWLSNFGPYVCEFEEKLAELFQVSAVATVCNATLGLMIALEAAGSRGEVIVPSYTFPATAQAVLWTGRRPVLADIDPEQLTLSADSVRQALTKDTCAIMPMHCFGMAADMENLTVAAESAGLPLICDATHAVGTVCQDRPLPGSGNIDVVSFHATKILSIGEGGAIIGNDKSMVEEARARSNYGFDSKHRGKINAFGLNAKLAELPAIIGLSQIERLKEMLEKRKEWAQAYRKRLSGAPGLKFFMPRKGCEPNNQFFPLELASEEFGISPEVLAWSLERENVVSRSYFCPPLHQQPSFLEQNIPQQS